MKKQFQQCVSMPYSPFFLGGSVVGCSCAYRAKYECFT